MGKNKSNNRRENGHECKNKVDVACRCVFPLHHLRHEGYAAQLPFRITGNKRYCAAIPPANSSISLLTTSGLSVLELCPAFSIQ